MLFEHGVPYTVVKSSRWGLMQHDVYSWEVTRNDLVRLDSLTSRSRFIDRTLKEWIGGLDAKERERFTDALYAVLSSTEAKSFFELGAGWLKNAVLMVQSLAGVNESTRDLLFRTIAALLRAAKNNIWTLLPGSAEEA
jgi:hypothetical protein